ncbi:MAG TPA: FAD-dependent oxidoreductase [Hyphomicrobiaceae bacterium]|nr:FAD-dependent oxidoreductase [Hyphomicrobiaceae bacterium]
MTSEHAVVVIGGGLAGMTAALTAARLGWRTAVLTGTVFGGQLASIDKIEGLPGFPAGVAGYDLCAVAQEQAETAGAEFLMASCDHLATLDGVWRIGTNDGGTMITRSVIIASGTAMGGLGVPGEARLAGKGVSACASCDAPLLRDKVAVVAGGGDSGLQEALTLAEHAAKVVVVERGDALTGQASFRDRIAANDRIEVRLGSTVTEILGEEAVTHVRIRDAAAGTESDLAAHGVFACVGLTPNTGLFRALVPVDAGGGIVVDAAMRTPERGVCAAGSVRQGSPHRAVSAMGDGAAAAAAIDRYLSTGEWRA